MEGISSEKAVGKKVTKVFPGVAEFGLLEVFRRVWRSGKPEHFPAKAYKDQRIAGWRENYVFKLGTGDVVAIYQDLTSEKQAEEAFRIAEQKYETVVESAADYIFMVDGGLMLASLNRKAAARVGVGKEQLIGKPVHELFPKELSAGIEKNCRHVLETGVGISTVEKLPANGNGTYLSISLNPVVDSQDKVVMVSGIVRDITPIKETEAALKQIGEHYRSLFDNSPVALLEGDFSEVKKALGRLRGQRTFDFEAHARGHPEKLAEAVGKIRVLDVNIAAIGLFGSKNKEAIRTGLQGFLAGELSAMFINLAIHMLKKKAARAEAFVRNGPGGEPFSAIVESIPLPGSETSWKKVLVSITDTTELKMAREEIRKGREELERLSEAAAGMEVELADLRKKMRRLDAEKLG